MTDPKLTRLTLLDAQGKPRLMMAHPIPTRRERLARAYKAGLIVFIVIAIAIAVTR